MIDLVRRHALRGADGIRKRVITLENGRVCQQHVGRKPRIRVSDSVDEPLQSRGDGADLYGRQRFRLRDRAGERELLEELSAAMAGSRYAARDADRRTASTCASYRMSPPHACTT